MSAKRRKGSSFFMDVVIVILLVALAAATGRAAWILVVDAMETEARISQFQVESVPWETRNMVRR